MQTVNFQCGHCGNLMAVTTDMLGQQVRCPHCQHVVVAPAATAQPIPATGVPPPAPSAPEAPFNFTAVEEKESIFTPDEQVSEDVFGAVPRPVLEPPATPPPFSSPPVPPPSPFAPPPAAPPANPFANFSAPPAPPPEPSSPFQDLAAAPAPAPLPPPESANPFAGFAPAPANTQPAAPPDQRPASESGSWSALPGQGNWTDSESSSTRHDPHPDLHREPTMRVTARANSGWVTIAVIVPLISYAILATILIAVLYARLKNQVHPLEALPDLEGDNTGARKLAIRDRVNPTMDLPDKLKVALGNTIRIGDLEVTPTRVEQKHIRYLYPNPKTIPNDSSKPCLVLHLQLKNVSDNVAFKPTDPVFLKEWHERQVSGRPYTFLDMGSRRFSGGPIRWQGDRPPRQRADCSIEGHNPDRELKPGDTMTTIVCTHPDQNAPSYLGSHQGKLLWRVQLRRGLVQVKNREVSATAVIGVEFSKGDIKS